MSRNRELVEKCINGKKALKESDSDEMKEIKKNADELLKNIETLYETMFKISINWEVFEETNFDKKINKIKNDMKDVFAKRYPNQFGGKTPYTLSVEISNWLRYAKDNISKVKIK